MAGKPAPGFTTLLLEANPDLAESFASWLFLPGMRFGEWQKWWPADKARRPAAHEGLDFLHYRTKTGAEERLDSGVQVPSLCPGVVAAIFADLLGQTVLIAAGGNESGPYRLAAFYAHLRPVKGLQTGDTAAAGAPLGRLSESSPRPAACPPHLHLSLALVHRDLDLGRFHWADFRSGEKFHPRDPYEFL
jgi:hypothetical protein